jgi:hypothetical protein
MRLERTRVSNRCSHAQYTSDGIRKLCFQRDRHRIGNWEIINELRAIHIVFRGTHILPEIYCQSKQIDKKPSPSFPPEPPNIRVKSAERGFARQNIENPVRSGNIHSGRISQKKMLS